MAAEQARLLEDQKALEARMRRDGEAVEYHAGTVEMGLWRTDTEAYLVAMSNDPPSIYVVMREAEDPASPHDLELVGVTASPYEAQDYADTGEEIVEQVPAPEGLIAWIHEFVERHHVEEEFVKRRRDKRRIDWRNSAERHYFYLATPLARKLNQYHQQTPAFCLPLTHRCPLALHSQSHKSSKHCKYRLGSRSCSSTS